MGVNDHSFEDCAARMRAQGHPFAIATIVRTVNATSAKPGAKAIVTSDGAIAEGWVGGGCIRRAVGKAAQAAISTGTTQFISLRPEEILEAEGLTAGENREGVQFARNGCPSKGSMDIFIEPVLPQSELVVCGNGPVANALADLADRFDFRVTQFAAEAIDFDKTSNGPQFVIIATQGTGDETALRSAFAADPRFIAFVGSRRKYETLATRLVASGLPAEMLERVKSPAGLDIGAITPDEIALSILSEVVMKRRALQRSGEVENDNAS